MYCSCELGQLPSISQLSFHVERTYKTEVVDILSRQVLDMLQPEAPFCLFHGVNLR